jgi:hypothetical protein
MSRVFVLHLLNASCYEWYSLSADGADSVLTHDMSVYVCALAWVCTQSIHGDKLQDERLKVLSHFTKGLCKVCAYTAPESCP